MNVYLFGSSFLTIYLIFLYFPTICTVCMWYVHLSFYCLHLVIK